MEEDNQLGFEFPGLGRRKIEANFAGGQVSSDGGIMLLAGGSSLPRLLLRLLLLAALRFLRRTAASQLPAAQ